MMLLMFVLWFAVFIGVFARQRWVIPLALVSMVYTLIVLKSHMTDPIPLNF
ncbi:MAG: hypothetical protein RJB01_843 [Actinomycetota bacterium]|jgi:hypothetical protein